MKNKFTLLFAATIVLLLNLFTTPNPAVGQTRGEGDTHNFAQNLQQLLNNNASISSINIAAQSYPVKKVTVSYRYNNTKTDAVTMEVTVGGTSWGTFNVNGTGSNYSTHDFEGESTTGAIVISFTNNTGSGTGHGTFYVNNVTLTEGASTYTVTYDGNGKTSGDVPTDSNSPYNSGATVTVLGKGNLERTGYTWSCWNTQANGGGTSYDEDDTFEISANTTLFAKWTPNKYNVAIANVDNVVLSAAYGTNSTLSEGANANIDYGTHITLSYDNLVSGNALAWVITKNSDNTDVTSQVLSGSTLTVPDYDITVSATLTQLPQYTITFNPGSGTCGTSPTTYYEGTEITDFPIATPSAACNDAGYTFDGWAEASVNEGSTSYTKLTSYTVSGNATLHAVYKLGEDSTPTAFSVGSTGSYAIVSAPQNNKYYALPTNPTVSSGKITAQEITVSEVGGVKYIKTADAEGFIWTIATATNGYTLYDGSKYIYHSNGGASGTDLAYGNSTSYTWSFTADGNYIKMFGMSGNSTGSRGLMFSGITIGGYSLNNWDNSSYYKTMILPVIDAAIAYYATSPSCNPVYEVEIDDQLQNGTIVATPSQAEEGADVTLTITPDDCYQLKPNTLIVLDGNGDEVTVTNNIFTMPDSDVTVSAEFEAITYTVQYSVNGTVVAGLTENVDCGSNATLPTTGFIVPDGYTFVGWRTSESGDAVVPPYTPEADAILYAVFSSNVPATKTYSFTINTSYFNKTSYSANDGDHNSVATATTGETMNVTWTTSNVMLSNDGESIQWKKSGSSLSSTNLGTIISVDIEETSSNALTLSISGGSFSITDDGGTTTGYASTVEVVFEKSTPSYYTLVKDVAGTETIANVEASHLITVKNGGVLTLTGTNNGTAANLIIADGGQISVSNTGVQATFQKSVTGFGSLSKEDENPYNDNYKLIAKPTVDDETNVLPANIGNMLTTDPNNYDLYYFDENKNGAEWRNYKVSPFTINNGQGYLYANSEDVILNFAGEVPTATTKSGIELSYTSGNNFAGFNLIGNPFAVNITSMKINTTPCGYFKLENDGTFTVVTNVALDPVVVGQGFMVEAEADSDKLHLNPSAKDEESFSNETIRLEVANGEYTDVAYICFGNMMPLTKINHMNEEAPMIYIHNEKSDKAVAVYNNRGEVKSFNVNFEAKTTGRYTISGKMMNGEVKYMHLYDRLTGVDTDLLTDSYTFIGAKGDNAGRFILNLESVDNGSSTGSETFAWQSGSEIIVDGEGTLEVYDVTGRKVMNAVVNGAHKVSGLNNGLYIFKLNGKTQKIIVR